MKGRKRTKSAGEQRWAATQMVPSGKVATGCSPFIPAPRASLGLASRGSLLGALPMTNNRLLTVAHDSAHALAKGEGRVAGRHLLRVGWEQRAAEKAGLQPSRPFVPASASKHGSTMQCTVRTRPTVLMLDRATSPNWPVIMEFETQQQGPSHLLEGVVRAASKQLAQRVEAARGAGTPAAHGKLRPNDKQGATAATFSQVTRGAGHGCNQHSQGHSALPQQCHPGCCRCSLGRVGGCGQPHQHEVSNHGPAPQQGSDHAVGQRGLGKGTGSQGRTPPVLCQPPPAWTPAGQSQLPA